MKRTHRFVKIEIVCTLLLCLITASAVISVPIRAEMVSEVTENQLSEIRTRLINGFERGDVTVDLSDMSVVVDLRSDGFSPEYQRILDVGIEIEQEYLRIPVGPRFFDLFGFILFNTEETEAADQWGCGPNRLVSATFCLSLAFQSEGSDHFDPEKLKEDAEVMAQEYRYALNRVREDMTDLEKALTLHDYLISLCDYPDSTGINEEDNSTLYDYASYEAVGLLRDHKPVCEAYATVYAWLLNDCGVPAITLTSEDMSHAWTMLKLGDDWYHTDVTWDDQRYESVTAHGDFNEDHWDIGAISHDYFLLTDEEIGEDHYGWSIEWDWSESGLKEAPAAPEVNAFRDELFRDNDYGTSGSHFYKLGEYWYFNTAPDGIKRAEELSSQCPERVDLPYDRDQPVNAIVNIDTNGLFLIFHNNDCVYGYDPENEAVFPIFNTLEHYGKDAIISEMAYSSETLRLVVIVPRGSVDVSVLLEEWDSFSETIPEDDLKQIYEEALNPTEEETVPEEEFSSDTDPLPDAPDTQGESDHQYGAFRKKWFYVTCVGIIIGGITVGLWLNRRKR